MSRAIRHATTADVWAIHETARESWHAAYDDLLGPDRVDEIVDEWYAIGDVESSIDETTGRDDAAFFVAESDSSGHHRVDSDAETAPDSNPTETVMGPPCSGFAHVVPWPENDAVAYLARIYVRPDDWGEGVGTALLERVEREFAHAFDRLRLAVLADNDVGVSFCESRAFERVDTYDSDLGDDLEEYVYEQAF
ncbi:GNAT family N-acetyltransferase [Halosolutus gelatinilyticus]|uniref:GNAT family N-acetyltransferase n=1 Tax=Halosolutus gelatinilyticus TaxID=2931975 RepID=UPI001FF11A38|nr:GNAT family N-acetyltransferase [Halosolutus gelatinilyticus]